jgi:hypothetical protein
MKIARYRDANGEGWGAVDVAAGSVRPLVGTAVEAEMRERGSGRFLQPGDEIEFEFEFEGIGVLRSRVGPRRPTHVGYPSESFDAIAARG